MSRFPTDRYDEQRLIQEVLYLHSLWHQGPPRPHPHSHPYTPIPTPTPTPTPVSLQPSSSTQFKKQKKNSKKLKETIIDSGIEWPCPKTPTETLPVTDSGWPAFTTQLNTQPHLPTSQELAHFASNQAHQHALKAVSEYLKYSTNDEYDDNDSENDDDMADEGDKDYNFFTKLFREDGVLREYYEKNKENGGEFSCLVCCGVGKKGWMKRFKDCVALVQHSITVANTNTRRAHRAYGQVICQVLGWDINRLPSIVLTAGDSNKPSEPVEAQGNENGGGKNGLNGQSNTTDTVNVGSDELSQLKESFSTENQQENGGGSAALEHKSFNEASVSSGIPETAKENAEGASCPGDENDGTINGLNGQSNTTDTVNVGSNELSQQKESFSTENQQENGGRSTALENPPIEASATRSLEDVSIGILETAKGNAEGASNCQNPPIEASATRSLEDVSIGILETAKGNAEGASNCQEPLQQETNAAEGESS